MVAASARLSLSDMGWLLSRPGLEVRWMEGQLEIVVVAE